MSNIELEKIKKCSANFEIEFPGRMIIKVKANDTLMFYSLMVLLYYIESDLNKFNKYLEDWNIHCEYLILYETQLAWTDKITFDQRIGMYTFKNAYSYLLPFSAHFGPFSLLVNDSEIAFACRHIMEKMNPEKYKNEISKIRSGDRKNFRMFKRFGNLAYYNSCVTLH